MHSSCVCVSVVSSSVKKMINWCSGGDDVFTIVFKIKPSNGNSFWELSIEPYLVYPALNPIIQLCCDLIF